MRFGVRSSTDGSRSAHLYGDGQAGPRIAEVLARTTLSVQKRIQDLNVLGVIPARGGSKGILRKNLAPLAGRPLLAYTTHAALASGPTDPGSGEH